MNPTPKTPKWNAEIMPAPGKAFRLRKVMGDHSGLAVATLPLPRFARLAGQKTWFLAD
jgi:hypothetical protein